MSHICPEILIELHSSARPPARSTSLAAYYLRLADSLSICALFCSALPSSSASQHNLVDKGFSLHQDDPLYWQAPAQFTGEKVTVRTSLPDHWSTLWGHREYSTRSILQRPPVTFNPPPSSPSLSSSPSHVESAFLRCSTVRPWSNSLFCSMLPLLRVLVRTVTCTQTVSSAFWLIQVVWNITYPTNSKAAVFCSDHGNYGR